MNRKQDVLVTQLEINRNRLPRKTALHFRSIKQSNSNFTTRLCQLKLGDYEKMAKKSCKKISRTKGRPELSTHSLVPHETASVLAEGRHAPTKTSARSLTSMKDDIDNSRLKKNRLKLFADVTLFPVAHKNACFQLESWWQLKTSARN